MRTDLQGCLRLISIQIKELEGIVFVVLAPFFGTPEHRVSENLGSVVRLWLAYVCVLTVARLMTQNASKPVKHDHA